MKILGIDTILHDVCVAVVEDGRFVLSNVNEHTVMKSDKLYNLVDSHLNQIGPVIKRALTKSKCKMEDISLISVNNFGSFFSNVSIGLTAAEVLASVLNKPLIQVYHQEAHYFSNWLEREQSDFNFPILVLSSSGGHSGIIKILNNKFEFKELFRIDAMKRKSKNKPNFRGIGAVYSYLADALKIGGPISSGPVISDYAKKGDKNKFNLTKEIGSFDITKLDFSKIEKIISKTISEKRKKKKNLSQKFISDLCASFEQTMGELISNGLLGLVEKEKIKEVHLVGGISANDNLRNILSKDCLAQNLEFKYPVKKSYCTDNAAMIASLGYYKYKLLSVREKKELLKNHEIKINSNLKLEQMALNQRKNNVK